MQRIKLKNPGALRHGGYSANAVLGGEDRAEFEELHRDLISEFSPDGALEHRTEKLAYLSSAGLRVILRAAKQLQENRGELTICNAKGGVRDALETFGLHSLMKIYNTEKEALLHFSSDESMDASRQSRASPAVSASRSAVVSLVCRSSCATSRRPKRLAHFRGPRSNDVGRSSSRPASRGSSFGPASLMSPKTRTERFTLGPHLGRH